MKLHTIALGCQMSQADGDEMSAPLIRRGFSREASLDRADAVLISTCTVRQHAEDRALSLIGSLKEWKERDPKRLLIVAGCAAERLGPWIQKRFSHVDLVVGAKSIEQYPRIIEEALRAKFDFPAENRAAFDEASIEPTPVSSFVTIMRGCNYSCSYCIVPAVRGRELYRPVSDVLREAREKAAAGAREIMLLGQTVNSYHQSDAGRAVDFADLLRLVDEIPGLERVRFMSPHPYFINDRLIAALSECRTSCPALHLPAQSGSDRVLKLMRRNYTRDGLLRKIDDVRGALGNVVISTDIIVGFPTETDEEFESSLTLLDEMGASSAYCFKFSPRESTEAAQWSDDVPLAVKEDRLRRLNAVVDRRMASALEAQVGRTVEVLTEEPSFGRARSGFKVRIGSPVEPGRTVRVKITGTTRLTLSGEIDPGERP